MPKSFLGHQVTVRQGAYLPHWTLAGATYAVCFRLADSLPRSVVADWRRERAALLAEARDSEGRLTPAVQERLRELFSTRVEAFLDAGQGCCELRQPEIAQRVIDALRHFHDIRYRLAAWCVMPNHVHVVVEPLGGHALSAILKSWKGFCGKEANRLLGRQGDFWQAEYYDHLIRDEAEFVHAVRYVLENPAKVRLVDWPWVWVSDEARARVAKWQA
ncbi:MAG: transposase [Verrucomicrobia bacterium]|nr:transposase [Verrucomicrobiota bacterium]